VGSKADVVQAYIAAIAAGDINGIAEVLGDDVAVHIAGRSPIAGDHAKGPWLGMIGGLIERSGGSMEVSAHDILESSDHVVALIKRKLMGLDSSAVVTCHVADGKITELWLVDLDQYAMDEAMAG
jgi:ketosteroid isomerase-like protein